MHPMILIYGTHAGSKISYFAIYHYCNLDLVVTIAKIVQNDLKTTKKQKSSITFLDQFMVTLLGLQLY